MDPGTRDHEHQIVLEAMRLIEAAPCDGFPLRLLGSTAVRYCCTTHADLFRSLGRPVADIDLAAYRGSAGLLPAFMSKRGYETDVEALTLFGHERQIYDHSVTGVHVDVFFDRLRFCHEIDLQGRLEMETVTIPLTDLVLSKVQIVEMTEVDLQDLAILLAEHEVLPSKPETLEERPGRNAEKNGRIDPARIARALARHWGFYYTAMRNLERLAEYVGESPLNESLRDRISARVRRIRERADSEPKPLSWRARARIGPRVKWYVDVDDVRR